MSESDEKPRRDGIAEILRSGRAPGMIVRGDGFRHLTVPVSPLEEGTKDLEKRKRINDQIMAEKRAVAEAAKERSRGSRKKDGAIRHVASVPMDDAKALKRTYGKEFSGENRKQILKEHGYLWDK